MVTKYSLRIRSRFALVLLVVVPALLGASAVGLGGLQTGRATANSLYGDHLVTIQKVTSLGRALQDVRQTSLQILLADGATERQQLTATLLKSRVPAVESQRVTVAALVSTKAGEAASVQRLSTGWSAFQTLLGGGELFVPNATATSRSSTARQVIAALNGATAAADSVVRSEDDLANAAHKAGIAGFNLHAVLILLVGLIGLISSAGVVIWLIRSVLPRTLQYAAFASEISHGDYTRRLHPEGSDELAHLGQVLNELAERRAADDAYDANQLELIETLQLTESEQEAHAMVKRHLQRSVPGISVAILNRNNSADRLEAVTPVEPESPLASGLESAKPRSCLAVRQARAHEGGADSEQLLPCSVCSGCPALTTCTPFIVGGEVIGSVVVEHREPLTDASQRAIREAVTQAAPVISNLRNLAIAELRASTDSLTGLPNRRAIDSTIRRMVAQAGRTVKPVAALMCDLDRFKQINDQYGHSRGDDALAAVGAVLSAAVRTSDFAGRYGGEEFLLLLSDTDAVGARQLAEKIRATIASVRIPAIEHAITMSVGIAVLPDHALDADSLMRAADRALYIAKSAGRDRVEVVGPSPAVPAARVSGPTVAGV